ncbi:unnamed protein product [Penicillium salamii]|uniref:Rhodopsin domain-containing protein n=1 Tax=Penicillium salamii TaxID=1612424 RepID=A0A9W4ISM3_9EURO|nr:unnamed protein product [Penicillium salamii]CAG8018927.1 unnamed protein product [Penicillium salamii]CAG8126349.1 unnamed protein product [Penicillium salamii]CAG8319432.1 unnamed protein product [Penicillium salamii]CAG8351277.1 unnamed protein product [Penicillium salamii]
MSAEHLGGLQDENQGPRIIIATAITTAAALIVVIARFYVRICIIRNVGWDDYVMGLTMLLSASGFAITVPEVKYGAGRHVVFVGETAKTAMHLNFATQAIYLWAIGTVKISIGLFLLRFAGKKGYKWFIWVVMVAMMLYTAICFLTLIFQCKDIRTNWDPTVKSECFSPTQLLTLSYTNTGEMNIFLTSYFKLTPAALNILTDLIFSILPVFMLRHLQVNRRVKASLICILGLGVFACAAAFVKLSILPNYGRTGDFLWDYTNLTIWVVTECNTGIVAGSLPTLKPLFKKVLGSYASQSKTARDYFTFKRSKLRSASRSDGTPLESLAHNGNRSVVAHHTPTKNLYPNLESPSSTPTDARSQASNSSEERILPIQGEILCTTEVRVSHTNDHPLPSGPPAPTLGRMRSFRGMGHGADDRV